MATMTEPPKLMTGAARFVVAWVRGRDGDELAEATAVHLSDAEAEMLDLIEDHHPGIGSWIDDSTWLDCSCGWDSSKPKAVDWHQHLIDALSKGAPSE